MTSLPERLSAGLLAARRARDEAATAALRTTLAALANAEAPPAADVAMSSSSPPVVGLVEHERLTLTPSDHERIVREQIHLRAAAAQEYDALGQPDAAVALRAEIAALEPYLAAE